MTTHYKIVAGIFLAAGSMVLLPAALAKQGINEAYEDFSGTHVNTYKTAQEPARMSEGKLGPSGKEGESGMSGSKTMRYDVDQAFEDFSGTHASPIAMAAPGLQGRVGTSGERGAAGRVLEIYSPFNLPGDKADGCSKYLRCSAE